MSQPLTLVPPPDDDSEPYTPVQFSVPERRPAARHLSAQGLSAQRLAARRRSLRRFTTAASRYGRRCVHRVQRIWRDDTGAVTAEYAIVILAAVAFAGLLVVILRSDEVRAMLTQLVQNALGTGGE